MTAPTDPAHVRTHQASTARFTSRHHPLRALLVGLVVLLVTSLLPQPAPAESRLPDAIADLARELQAHPPGPGDSPDRDTEDDQQIDPSSVGAGLDALIARAEGLRPRKRNAAASAARGREALARAASVYASGTRGPDADHIAETLDHLAQATTAFQTAARQLGRNRAAGTANEIAIESVVLAAEAVQPIIGLAADAGVRPRKVRRWQRALDQALDLLAAGDTDGAVGGIGQTYADASSSITFDVELFEQNLRDTFDGETVGYTYAIGVAGALVAEDGVGQAQTAPDSAAPQHANKQVQVASVSKTLTAILVLRLMADAGVAPDDLIHPYLPGNWVLGDGMEQVTFRQLLTHTSGFKQLANSLPDGSGAGHTYEGLQTFVGFDLTAGDGPYSYLYTNLNFSLLRVLASGLMGIDPVDYPEFEGGTLTAAAFAINLESVYSGIGVPASCTPTDPVPTLMYQWPLDGVSNGAESSDKVLECGAYGFFISARQLTQVLSNLRYTENLLSESQLDQMRDELLGLQSWNGAQGTYLGHGGQWNPGMQSCVMMFPISVDVSITVNSIGGNYPSPCNVARTAFDTAWVAT